ncbi:hypothetical protein LINPERPRIM_LOCUS20465 [Linum perenne]
MRYVTPTRSTLRRRGIEMVDKCGMCSSPGETIEHMMFSCVVMQDCWRAAGMQQWVSDFSLTMGAFADVMFSILESGAEERIQGMVMTLWALWKERNERVWSSKSKSAEVTVRLAVDELDGWKSVQTIWEHESRARTEECKRWHPLESGYVKCNVDVALSVSRAKIGVGRVVRDELGAILNIHMNNKEGCLAAREEEMEAVLESLAWMRDMGYEKMIMETDNLSTVLAINGEEENVTEFGE